MSPQHFRVVFLQFSAPHRSIFQRGLPVEIHKAS
nr:MAG TPA: hypothetical protein [Caudoviricetes sp.]